MPWPMDMMDNWRCREPHVTWIWACMWMMVFDHCRVWGATLRSWGMWCGLLKKWVSEWLCLRVWSGCFRFPANSADVEPTAFFGAKMIKNRSTRVWWWDTCLAEVGAWKVLLPFTFGGVRSYCVCWRGYEYLPLPPIIRQDTYHYQRLTWENFYTC